MEPCNGKLRYKSRFTASKTLAVEHLKYVPYRCQVCQWWHISEDQQARPMKRRVGQGVDRAAESSVA